MTEYEKALKLIQTWEGVTGVELTESQRGLLKYSLTEMYHLGVLSGIDSIATKIAANVKAVS